MAHAVQRSEGVAPVGAVARDVAGAGRLSRRGRAAAELKVLGVC